MGILDEAIRQHLELKRQHGADDSELAQLEDEAFGPPTRPGEPDFPERSAEAGEETSPAETSGEAKPPAAEPAPEAPAAGPEAAEHPVVEPAEPATEPEPQGGFFDQDVEAGEPRPAPEAAAEAEAEPEPEAPSIPAEEAERAVEPEPEVAAEPEPEVAAEPEPPSEPPIESLETVEHRIDDVVIEGDTGEQTELVTGEQEVVEEEAVVVEYEEGEEEGGEDVLEETPEFLRDAPEDDELWFEQGEPKDFDF